MATKDYTCVDIWGWKLGGSVTRMRDDIIVDCAWGRLTTNEFTKALTGKDDPQFSCKHYELSFPRETPDGAEGYVVGLCAACETRMEAGARLINEETGRELIQPRSN